VERWGDKGWVGDYLGAARHQNGIAVCYTDNSGERSVIAYRNLLEPRR